MPEVGSIVTIAVGIAIVGVFGPSSIPLLATLGGEVGGGLVGEGLAGVWSSFHKLQPSAQARKVLLEAPRDAVKRLEKEFGSEPRTLTPNPFELLLAKVQETPLAISPVLEAARLQSTLSSELDDVLFGHNPTAVQFIRERLAGEIQAAFRDKLAQSPEAWQWFYGRVLEQVLVQVQKNGQFPTWESQLRAELTGGQQTLQRAFEQFFTQHLAAQEASHQAQLAEHAATQHRVLDLQHMVLDLKQTIEQRPWTPPASPDVLPGLPIPALTFLHLSKLTFGADSDEATHAPLLTDVARLCRDQGKPDYILITGDIALTGKKAEFDAAALWLKQLCAVAGVDNTQVLMVPGNHDVDRRLATATRTAQNAHRDAREKPVAELDYYLGAEEELKLAFWPKLSAYADFARGFGAPAIAPSSPWWTLELRTELGPVRAVGLNTSLLSYDEHDSAANQALGSVQLDRALKGLNAHTLLLVLLHHPSESLVDGDELVKRTAPYPHLVMAGPGLMMPALSQPAEKGVTTCAWVRLHASGIDYLPRMGSAPGMQDAPRPRQLSRTALAEKLQAWLPNPSSPRSTQGGLAPFVPHPFVPPAWTGWARKEYDTLIPLTASQAPVSFRLERIYVELHSKWQTPAELEAQRRSTHARSHNTQHYDLDELDVMNAGAEDKSEERRPLSELVALPDAQRLALRGGPGSGKSTFLRRLLLQRLSDSGSEPVLPLYLELKELGVWLKEHPNGGTSPEQLIAWAGERLAKWGLSAEALTQRSGHGRILWLLDGLDEIFQDELRQRAALIIGGYFKHAPGADRLVLAGRPHAFEDARIVCNLGLENRVADLDLLTDEERAEFLQKWFAEVYPHNAALAHEQAEALTRAIPQHKKVDELSRTPLLLSTMAAVYQMGRVLPERRADLYDKAVDVMLHRRFGGHLAPGDYTQRQARRALTVAARGMMLSGEVRSLGRREFERVILDAFHPTGATEDQQKKLDELTLWLGAHSGLLALRGDPLRVTFSHLALQEFLCAEWYASLGEPLTALEAHLDAPSWQEVVLLTGGILLMDGRGQLGERFLNGLLDRTQVAAHLAWRTALLARVVTEAPDGSLPVGFAEQLKPRLVEVIGSTTLPSTYRDRVTVGQCLGRLGDPRLGLEKPENWIWLPPGEFRMGSDEKRANKKPVRKVTVTRGFYLSRFPVTNQDFEPFIDAGGYTKKDWWSEEGWAFCQENKLVSPDKWGNPRFNAPNQQVVGVSWYEAEAFCHWMNRTWPSREEGLVVRLPTEAEWEYAARGKEGRKYPWGNDEPTPERANYDKTGLNQTSPVGAFPLGASKDGLLDLAGNCREWCEDVWTKNYEHTPCDDSAQREGNHARRVVRGGAWSTDPDWLRSSSRDWGWAGRRDGLQGFRLVRASLPSGIP